MSMKQTALALACVGGCALSVVSPSFAASATAFQSGASPAVVAQAAMVGSEDRPSENVEVVVRLKEGADRAAVLASIREAVAESFPGGSVEVEYEYENLVQGFGLSVPDGSVEVIRGVSGVGRLRAREPSLVVCPPSTRPWPGVPVAASFVVGTPACSGMLDVLLRPR